MRWRLPDGGRGCSPAHISSPWARRLLNLRRQRHREGGTFAQFARGLEFAAHHLTEFLADRQAQTRAAIFASGGRFRLYKGLKHASKLLLGHADAAVSDDKFDQ